MPITLKSDTKKQLLASIKRYVAENLELDIGDLHSQGNRPVSVHTIAPLPTRRRTFRNALSVL